MARKYKKPIGKESPKLRSNRTKPSKTQRMLIHEEVLSLLRECSEAKNIDESLKIITNQACVLVGGKGGSVWLMSSEDPSKIILRWTYRPGGPNIVRVSYYVNTMGDDECYDGLTGWVFATGKPLCLRDITDKNEISRYPHLRWSDKHYGYEQSQEKEKHKHFMAVPIFSCRVKKEVIGVLRIGSSATLKAFQPRDLELLKIYSGYISGLLTNYLKREEERTLIENLFTLAGLTDLESLLQEIAKTIPIVMDGSYCSIFLRDQQDEFCLEATSAPHLQEFVRKGAQQSYLKYKPGEGKTGRVALTGNSMRVRGNIKSESGKSADLCECGTTSGAFLAIAIREKEGKKPVGVLRVVRSLEIGEEFDEEDERFLERFGQNLYKCLIIHGYFAKGTCFVITSFDEPFTNTYHTIIRPVVEKCDFICRREDEYGAVGGLTTGIVSHIASASFIIADITGDNRNVYYELGIAHTLDKTVILISQTPPPSDVQHWKYIKYKDAVWAATKLASEIESAIKEGIAIGKIKSAS